MPVVRKIIIPLLLLLCSVCFAQNDSTNFFKTDTIPVLKEVVVSGIIPARANEISWNITALSQQKMRAYGALNISDALAKLPGINQLTTGAGISKPVIRGLYGNRVLAVLSGLRFDNQQWQDEHGLGLNDIGIDRVEVIKGASGLLYGSESMGGTLNVIEEAPAKPGTTTGDINTSFFSNTYGIFTDVGFKGATEKNNWRVRAGINSQADYSDGDNKRILNSRSGGYYLKGSYEFAKKKWTSINQYSGSLDNYGFIMPDNLEPTTPDGRLSRSMNGPHHTVLLNVLSSQNAIRLQNSTLKLNAGAQSNLRAEDEGGNEISLKMLLSSLLYNAQWVKPINKGTELILGNNFLFQNNTNYGKRIIIPDANMLESGVAAYIKSRLNKIILEGGIGFSVRNVHTFETSGLNAPGKPIQPFNKTLPVMNSCGGIVINPNTHWNFKFNAGTGFRSGNLAELSSDGLHEGTLRYEIGDPDLKIEHNINTEIDFTYSNTGMVVSGAGFYNHFHNYIYLSPTGEQYYGFDVYQYKQADANLYGSEIILEITLPFYKPLQFESNFSTVVGKLTKDNYLPFIPASKWHNGLVLRLKDGKRLQNIQCTFSADNYFAQTHPTEFETPTDSYCLINAGLAFSWHIPKKIINISIAANNLLDKEYYDHLSRYKEYGIHNIGRNVVLNIHIPFSLN